MRHRLQFRSSFCHFPGISLGQTTSPDIGFLIHMKRNSGFWVPSSDLFLFYTGASLPVPALNPGNHYSPFQKCEMNGITQRYITFGYRLFSLGWITCRFIQIVACKDSLFLLLLRSVPLYGYTILLVIHLLKHIWVVSSLDLLRIKLLQRSVDRFLLLENKQVLTVGWRASTYLVLSVF